MTAITFTKAVKFASKGKLEVCGPSGSGKTWTALSIATAIGGKIAVLDTEHGSASKYSDLFDFDVFTMEPPYHPDRYVRAIQAAAEAGYTTLIIDSLSHAWFGTGGLLEIVDDFAKASKNPNTYVAWKKGTPIQLNMVEAILAAPMHIIATMRSKTEYVMEKDDKGRSVPRKIGMAPIQREGMEYEFDVQAEMNWDNDFIVTKTRCPGLSGKVFNKPTGKDICDILLPWLTGAPAPKPVPKPPQPLKVQPASPEFGLGDDLLARNKAIGQVLDDFLDGLPTEEQPAEESTKASPKLAPISPMANRGWWAELVKNSAAFGYGNHQHIINALIAEHWDQSAMDYTHRGDILECLRKRQERKAASQTELPRAAI